MTEPEIRVTAETELPREQEVADLICRSAREALRREGVSFPVRIDVTIVDNETIREMNARYRSHDAVTDVLSFPMYEFYNGRAQEMLERDPDDGRVLLGDMLLNWARACEQAAEYGHSPARECGFLTVHSCLHLLGYDHERGEADRRLMRAHEEAALDALGLTRG